MLYRSNEDNVKPIKIDYSTRPTKCTYSRDTKPKKDPFDEKRLKGEWI